MASIAETEKDNVQKRHIRKSGGKVPGKMADCRPDRRARGGATGSDPFSAAHNMSKQSYESSQSKPDGGGKGGDRD